uniref:Receptor kinase-like protein Xa21 n=1 Tax=Leersia perrieri TaxID=77586 RepID=A0A0D9XIP5_9ORYZ
MEIRSLLQLLALLTIVIFLLLTPASYSIDTDDDVRALLSFRSHITKDPLGALSSWSVISNGTSNGTSVFCRWKGVTCSSGTHPGHVASLQLQGLGLVGNISPLLGNLTSLRVLDLSDNKLEGEIPPSLGKCLVLQKLNLSVNFLSGAIPPAIGHLSNLVSLNIRNNNISGYVPSSFANLTALTLFSIADNYIYGQIPSWLGNLTALKSFNIADNIMSGTIPEALSKLFKLESLTIGGNGLDGEIPPTLFNLSSLEVFNLGDNQISGSLPTDIGFTLPNLRSFSVFYNQLEGQIPASFSNISVLEKFIVHGNRFRGKIPPTIGINGLLTVFEVGKNELQATDSRDWEFLTSLVNCSNLIYINLQLNNLSGILPNTIANLSQQLQSIRLGGNKISGHLPKGIGRYDKLTSLEFADNLFTGTIPPDIGKLTNLHELLLFENGFQGKIPASLGNITQLNQLLLSGNYLEGKIPATIGKLSKLTSMDLSGNLLIGQIPEQIMRISSLTELLNLSNNALGGSISPYIGELVNVGIIDLSSNKLYGEIPSTLGNCLALQFLYLQTNLLHGLIPKEFNKLRGLEVLDLSNNQFSGPIPEFLESFHLLKNLNLSFNNLSGLVPDKGIFSNASVVSVASNGMLCGGPLFFHFPPCPFQSFDKPAQRSVLHILIFPIVGAFVLFIVCIAACYCIRRLRAKSSNVNRDQGSKFLDEMYHRISYNELHVATDSFSVENLIGRGSFGSVYRGTFTRRSNVITVAVKVLDLQQTRAARSFLSECNALKRIRHRNLVKIITVCDSVDHNGVEFKALVLEFISNGNLGMWLHPTTGTSQEFEKLSLMQRINIALDVAKALEYLHHHITPSIVHCDIKPSNVLLDKDMTAHISDFSLATIISAETKRQCLGESSSVGINGTIGYLAPEYGMGTGISREGDIYSYGVLVLEMLTGRRPTDTMFHDAISLPKHVEMAYPDKLLDIMDSAILQDGNSQEVLDWFITPISRLGLACCRDSASQRIKMDEVVKELSGIKEEWENKFVEIIHS